MIWAQGMNKLESNLSKSVELHGPLTYMGKMTSKLKIRESLPSDDDGIEQLYADAFPNEDLSALVREILHLGQGVLSLVAICENGIAGHVCFTFCQIERQKEKVALLAPLAVTPNLQKQGIGSALVRTGFKEIEKSKIAYVLVLGDPDFYARFGFKAEDKVTTPYPLPMEWRGAWQSIKLADTDVSYRGRLSVPKPWRKTALWTS